MWVDDTDVDIDRHVHRLALPPPGGDAEGVRQVRGTSVNQVDGATHVLVTAGTGVPTSGLVLGQD